MSADEDDPQACERHYLKIKTHLLRGCGYRELKILTSSAGIISEVTGRIDL
jgi:hypothetical protein